MIATIARVLDALTNPLYSLIGFFSTRKSVSVVTNPILTTSATQLAKKIRNRELTCVEVVTAFIERCREVNPIVNAIIQDRFEDAIKEARNVDNFLRTDETPPSKLENEKPLLGIPITVKECCSVKGMMFSIGVKRYESYTAAYNGDAVQLFLNAGAILIAITSTPPYSAWIETFNSIIGYTNNPYDTRKTSGGSSGGEAALIATAASVLGLGSDAGGSIRIPAAFCGIYGHKPSKGTVSAKGHVTFFSNQEITDMITVGPLCRYSTDLELAMKVLSCDKLFSNRSTPKVDLHQINLFYLLEYEKSCFAVDPMVKNKIVQATEFLKETYGCRVELIKIPEFANIFEITSAHFQRITSATDQEANMQLPHSAGDTFQKCLKLIRNTSSKFLWKIDQKVYAKKEADLKNGLLKLLVNDGVLLLPTWSESAFYKYQAVFKMHSVCYDYFVNVFGFASTAVPIGLDDNNMPLSIQVIAAPNKDQLCFVVAKELEKLFGGWTPPYAIQP